MAMRALLSLLALGALATPAVAGPSIRVAREAEVPGSVVRLGDVARLRGFTPEVAKRFAAIELGRAPAPGLGQLLPKAFLEARIREGGVGPGVKLRLPARLEVRREARTLKGADLEKKVREAVRAAMPHDPADVARMRVPRLPDVLAPTGAELTVAFAPDERFEGHATATLTITDGADVVRTQKVNVRVDVYARAFGVRSAARRGVQLSAADLVELRLPASKLPRDAVRHADEVEGANLRRAVKPGEPLRLAWVKVPPLVRRGDRVRMIARRGGVEITATGEALGQGGRGENVRVRNLDSKRVVSGRIVAPNTVEMEF